MWQVLCNCLIRLIMTIVVQDICYTSPYKFYQFWLNVSDEDAARYIKISSAYIHNIYMKSYEDGK